ncbi:DUF202 domain-containing protein [Thalassorhabdomicrobium marinisediminis]|uniref:DUF202 domain-containing protein n=1 Tax=Thalassorhabdomicrobium marinisediminis TaxID=2170577 RepID=A0A2T7FYP0_9RHOB|nr:DUF202 domain-containing protein [Thalassorhabdomicrobium marinisediminis]PVA07280.1 DUF202 domain-containing protein [Thalassorhabdomicrobium marinisediminis]
MTDKTDLAEDRTEWAEVRTDWAEDRTIMANERTFVSWIGGGMGAIGVALAFQAIFGKFEPTWVAKTVATLPLITAVVLFVTAERKASQTLTRLNDHKVEASGGKTLKLVAGLLSLTALGTGGILWSL